MVKTADVLFTSGEAAGYTGGRLQGPAGVEISGFETDSRKCGAGFVFVALKGENTDGHNFIADAFSAGAAGAVVEAARAGEFEALLPEGCFFLYAEDPLSALQKAAAEYLRTVKGPVRIGITGSNGKTTTKELVAAVLAEKYSVVSTEGNYNSEIGLPQTVFRIKDRHEYAVIEMGINRVGEMDVLTEILRPDIVVITNIGTAHIGIFNTIGKIAYEKRQAVSLFDGRGTLFLDEDEEYRDFLSEGLKGDCRFYGERTLASSLERLQAEGNGLKGWIIRIGDKNQQEEIFFPLIGRHNLKNAFCAVSVGLHCGLTLRQIKNGLEKAEPMFGRSQVVEGPITVVQDCYNANIDSMLSSMRFVDELDWPGRRIYVLGDMKELGESSVDMHESVGRAAVSGKADFVLFYGAESETSWHEASGKLRVSGASSPELYWTGDIEKLEGKLLDILQEGDLLLLKASRTMNLERLAGPVIHKFRGKAC